MDTEKKKTFIINFMYFAIIVLITYFILKYSLPMLTPFVSAFVLSCLLKGPIRFLSGRCGLGRRTAAVLVVFLFYSTVGLLIGLLGIKVFSTANVLIANLPVIYSSHIEPVLLGIFSGVERSVLSMDTALAQAVQELWGQFVKSLGQMISGLSVKAMGTVSGLASSLPGLFVRLLLMIVSTFFMAADYENLTNFGMQLMSEKTKMIFLQVKAYVMGTLLVCVRSYALIMAVTFLELAVGLTVIGVESSVVFAFFIAIFDILPVLGTGGIMIPWTVGAVLQGSYPLALGLCTVYLLITVVRNILEPRIVGRQLGLHPVVTLAGMFVGAQMFGGLGLFGVPIGLSLVRHLYENGTLRWRRAEREEREGDNR